MIIIVAIIILKKPYTLGLVKKMCNGKLLLAAVKQSSASMLHMKLGISLENMLMESSCGGSTGLHQK